jgi:hypothetical protein
VLIFGLVYVLVACPRGVAAAGCLFLLAGVAYPTRYNNSCSYRYGLSLELNLLVSISSLRLASGYLA